MNNSTSFTSGGGTHSTSAVNSPSITPVGNLFSNLGTSFRNPQYPLPILDKKNYNVDVWKRQIEGWFNNVGMTDLKSRFETIINSIRFPNVVEELVRLESLWGRPLTLEESIPFVKDKLLYLNNMSDAFQQIKILTIRPNETVDSFNRRFLELYHSLGTQQKNQISVYDYLSAVRGRPDLHHSFTIRLPNSIQEVCQEAKNYEYWQEYNAASLNHNTGYYEPYRSQNYHIRAPYSGSNPYRYELQPLPVSSAPVHPEMYVSTPAGTASYTKPMTMTTYPMNEPISANVFPNNVNGASGTYKTYVPNPDPVPSFPANPNVKLCWSCGQPGHLRRDCGRLNH